MQNVQFKKKKNIRKFNIETKSYDEIDRRDLMKME